MMRMEDFSTCTCLSAINKYHGGGYGEGTEFLIRNVDGKLVIVDWYTGGKDTYDFMVRGDNVNVDDPEYLE